jgi:hypothetical protein
MPNISTHTAALFISLLLSYPAMAWERVYDFEKDRIDQTPEGLMLDASPRSLPKHHVRKDPDEDRENQVLETKGADFPGKNRHYLINWFSNLRNGSMSADIMFDFEKEKANSMGFVWRYNGPDDHYAVRYDVLKSVLSFVRVSSREKGKEKEKELEEDVFKRKKIRLEPKKWHRFKVTFEQDLFTFYIDDQPVLEGKNGKLNEPGKVGLFVQSDIPILVDNFKIESEE